MKTALITGITGQDGAYLAQLLLGKGYRVVGARRRSASSNTWRLQELGVLDQVEFVALDLLEFSNVLRVVETVRPDEIYNLAAMSFVETSFEQPIYSSHVTGIGPVHLLEAIRKTKPDAKFYQASTSEMFGGTDGEPLDETSPFRPRSPYAAAKLYAHSMTVNYREAHGLFAVSGLLFNHESPLRGIEFVTRKITAGLAEIAHGREASIELGNIWAERDWGFAGDYVRGMWMMMQRDEPKDYVLAQGRADEVKRFATMASEVAGFAIEWGKDITGFVHAHDVKTDKIVIKSHEKYYRPDDISLLIGNSCLAHEELDWQPTVNVEQLAEMMVRADMDRVKRGVPLL
jgi:GDPmannose 4,6-dehydratase